MPATRGDSIERMELTFRAEPVSGSRNLLPGGWALWCLAGCAVGIGAWLMGRELLLRNLRTQLTDARSASEALIAVEGLTRLSPDAGLEIVSGLEHPDPLIARTAYLRLDGLVTLWQSMDEEATRQRLEQLAKRLASFSVAAPQNNRLMASSLASRIYGICIASGSEQLLPTKDLCLQVLDQTRIAPTEAQGSPAEEFPQLMQQFSDLRGESTPEPLPSPSLSALSGTNEAKPLRDLSAPSNEYRLRDSLTETEEAIQETADVSSRSPSRLIPMASVRMTVGPTQPRRADYPQGIVETNVVEQPSFDLNNEVDGRWNDEAAGQSMSVSDSVEMPVVVATPATLTTSPIVQMKVVTNQLDLDGIQELPIEELVRLLASSETRIAQGAALALKAKGMNDEKLALASELATGTAERRIELIQQIAINGDFEPRPWLLWMAEDGEPQVRQMAVSLLSSMLDSDVERALGILLGRERDPMVAQAMRRVLLADRGGLLLTR